ncbi:MAG: PglZ domain-containing protein, partial [Thermoguttaceae bacterium]
MHEFHQHLSKQLAQHLAERAVVVWYDPRREFTGYVTELAGGARPKPCRLDAVTVGDVETQLCCAENSLYGVKLGVEGHVAVDRPKALVLYLPGYTRAQQTSPLAELELGGMMWEPQLKREARRVLKTRYGDGQIDQMLQSENVTYADVVGLLDDDVIVKALLSVIVAEARGDNAVILACWLADPSYDSTIMEKLADAELRQLVASRLGLEIAPEMPMDEARRRVARYVLLSEFRSDLQAEPPATVQMVPRPSTKDQLEMVRRVATELRRRHPAAYVATADAVEQEFSLSAQSIPPEVLGEIDTFRFEEALLLTYTGNLIFCGQYGKALEAVRQRRQSFWSQQDFRRQEQWRACEMMAELGQAVDAVGNELFAIGTAAARWVEGYTAPEGWHRVDLLHRRLESAQAAMSHEVESEKALCRVRNEYNALLGKMTRGFVAALKESGWSIPAQLQQTNIYSRKVAVGGEPVAYFLVDAMRYEMGVELARQLDGAEQLSLEPAVAALPTITPVGMAALLPGAEGSFSVVENGGKLSVRVD